MKTTANSQYRVMIKAYTEGLNEKALALAKSLLVEKLNDSKMKDVRHVIQVLQKGSK